MSKKRLSRTVIEGGRVSYNKWKRRDSSKELRADVRAYLSNVNKDEEYADSEIEPKLKVVHPNFNDKLGPMYRWLHAQVGKLWNDVRSEISKKFDDRTTAGRHILHDHLLSSVEEVPDLRYRYYRHNPDSTTSYSKNDFYVDADGVLQVRTYLPRHHNKAPVFNTASIANWLSGRCVGKVGNKFFWFVSADKNKKRGGTSHMWRTEWISSRYYWKASGLKFLYSYQKPIYIKDKEGVSVILEYVLDWRESSYPNFRQDRKLNDKEMVFWNSIPEGYQTKVLERSPTYPENLKPSIGNSRNY